MTGVALIFFLLVVEIGLVLLVVFNRFVSVLLIGGSCRWFRVWWLLASFSPLVSRFGLCVLLSFYLRIHFCLSFVVSSLYGFFGVLYLLYGLPYLVAAFGVVVLYSYRCLLLL